MIWSLMAISLPWLLFRKQWRCAVWVGGPAFLVLLVGSTPMAEALVSNEERPWAVHSVEATGLSSEEPPFDAVLILGGGCERSAQDLYGFAFRDGSSRVFTGIQLVRLSKGRNLVLGGSIPLADASGRLVTERLGQWVEASRLAPVPVFNLGACRNTHDEAVAFRQLQAHNRWKRVALVTSALHLPRSTAAFRKQGVQVVPVACDFQVYGVEPFPFSIFPRQDRFDLLSRYLHEKIGFWYYRVKGWA